MRPRSEFDYRLLDVTSHRPWPLPASPWILRQTWHDLLFAHWPLPPDAVRRLVPSPLALDTYDGRAWLGIVPFDMTNVAPRGVPALPGVSSFAELNVRTYVRLGARPGVYFFSLDAASRLAVGLARLLFALPYYTARIRVSTEGGWIHYRSRRISRQGSGAAFEARYRASGPVQTPRPGSLEYFLTERYCLYTVRGTDPCRLDIHHEPWPLQAAEAEIGVSTIASANACPLPAGPPLVHFSRRQDMIGWPLRRVR